MSLMEKDSLHYYLIGIECLNKGHLDDAIINFNESLMLEEHFKTYQKKAEILEKKGLYEESYNALEKAYNLNPSNDNVATAFSKMLQKNGNSDKAIEILNAILKRNPTYSPAKKILEQLGNAT